MARFDPPGYVAPPSYPVTEADVRRIVAQVGGGGGGGTSTAGGRTHVFSKTGTLAATTGVHRLYNDTSAAWTITSVRANVGTASAGASIIIDVNVDGVTIFTTQGNRPTIAIAGTTSGKVTNMNITTVAPGSSITVDVDQVGSTTAGSDLIVQVEVF